jgi:hypothetical protein
LKIFYLLQHFWELGLFAAGSRALSVKGKDTCRIGCGNR